LLKIVASVLMMYCIQVFIYRGLPIYWQGEYGRYMTYIGSADISAVLFVPDIFPADISIRTGQPLIDYGRQCTLQSYREL